MSLQGDCHQILVPNGSIASTSKRKGSPCSENGDGSSQAGKILRRSLLHLPEDIWRHIHSLMPLGDAARAACLSRAFLSSWRYHPNLIFNEDMLGLKAHPYVQSFSDTIDYILSNHSGIGVRILKIELDDISYRKLDSWLQGAVTPGIVEITITIGDATKTELGTLRSLTSLCLIHVSIEGDELECLLSNAPVLEQLDLAQCDKIICLKIPSVLERLICLKVGACWRLRVIENQAPNLSSLDFCENVDIIGKTSQVKNLISMFRPKGFCYALAELPSMMPNVETLDIGSGDKVVNTSLLPAKFLYLRHLNIFVTSRTGSPPYDYFSLISFLDASPSLETLSLDVRMGHQEHESILGQSSPWRQMTKHHHCSLKSVKITRFSSAKSLVELTCCILKNTVSLECLTLDTLPFGFGCPGKKSQKTSLHG